jgi:hypothetical protein
MIPLARLPCLLLACLLCSITEAATIRRVIGPGDPAPGVPGATFLNFAWPGFDYQGNITIDGIISDPQNASASRYGLWAEASGNLQLRGLADDPLPAGTNAERIEFWYAPSTDRDWIRATLYGPSVDATNDTAWIMFDPESARTIVRTGQPAPGMPAGTIIHSLGYHHGNSGTKNLYFDARLVGPGISVNNDESLWVDSGSGIRKVVQEGYSPPGGSAPIRKFRSVDVDESGNAAFVAELDSFTPHNDRDTAAYVERDGQIHEILRSGSQAAGLPADVVIESVTLAHVAPDGSPLFLVNLAGSAVDPTNNEALYADRGNGPELVARTGDPALDVPNARWLELAFQYPTSVIVVVASGVGDLRYSGSDWSQLPWPDRGEPAPGTSNRFGPGITGVANSLGQLAFEARFDDEQLIWDEGGFWAEEANGDLQLLLRSGDLVETGAGEFTAVEMSGWDIADFNERGEVLLRANLDGNVSLYVATLESVPEPATIVLAIAGSAVIALIFLRRQRFRTS